MTTFRSFYCLWFFIQNNYYSSEFLLEKWHQNFISKTITTKRDRDFRKNMTYKEKSKKYWAAEFSKKWFKALSLTRNGRWIKISYTKFPYFFQNKKPENRRFWRISDGAGFKTALRMFSNTGLTSKNLKD